MNSPDYRDIIELFRRHQRASQFVEVAFRTDVTLIETYVLVEFAIDSEASISRLAWLICVEKTAVARAIRRLRKRGLLKGGVHPGDMRRKVHLLTHSGRKVLRLLAESSRQFLSTRIPALRVSEIAELHQLISRLCDSVGGPPVVLLPSEHPFEIGIRRITRSLGFVGGDLFFSGYSSTVWQVLSLLSTGSQVTLSSMHRELGIHVSTLSQLCSRYEKKGWLQRKTAPDDSRKRLFLLTAQGRGILEKINRAGVAIFEKAFPAGEAQAGARLIELFGRYFHGVQTESRFLVRPAHEIVAITTEKDRELARGFFIYNLVRCGRLTSVPAHVLVPESRIYQLHRGDAPVALIEIYNSAPGQAGAQMCCTSVWNEYGEDAELFSDFYLAVESIVTAEVGLPIHLMPADGMFPPGAESLLLSRRASLSAQSA